MKKLLLIIILVLFAVQGWGAEYYFGFGGNDTTGDGSEGNPWATYAAAVSGSGAGDTLYLINGDLSAPASPGYFNFDADRIIKSNNYRLGTLEADTGYSTFVARTSPSLTAANNPFILSGIVFDAESRVRDALAIGTDDAEDLEIFIDNVWAKDATTNTINVQNKRGVLSSYNSKVSGSATYGIVASEVGTSGNQTITIDSTELDLINTSASVQTGILLLKVNNLTNTALVGIKNVFGKIQSTTGGLAGIKIQGVDAPSISNCNLEINTTITAVESYGIQALGLSTAVSSAIKISNNKINFFAPTGMGIMIGATANSYSTGGEISGNFVKGKFYTGNTPHGFVLSTGTNGRMVSNTAQDCFVSFIASKTTDGEISGNLAFNSYGPAYYVKGATDITIKNNIAVHSGKWDSMTASSDGIAMIAVTDQGGVDTSGADFIENYIVVADTSRINALAHKTTSQVCTFVRNTYVVPDTVNVLTTDLFSYDQAIGTAPNNTLAEWNAQAEVTDDRIIQMPVGEISRIISKLKPVTNKGGKVFYLGGGSGIR